MLRAVSRNRGRRNSASGQSTQARFRGRLYDGGRDTACIGSGRRFLAHVVGKLICTGSPRYPRGDPFRASITRSSTTMKTNYFDQSSHSSSGFRRVVGDAPHFARACTASLCGSLSSISRPGGGHRKSRPREPGCLGVSITNTSVMPFSPTHLARLSIRDTACLRSVAM